MAARWVYVSILSLILASCGGSGGTNATGSETGQPSASEGTPGSGSSDGGSTGSGSGSLGGGSPGSGGSSGDGSGESGDGASGGTDADTVTSPPGFAHDSTARFQYPGDLALDNAGNLYVMDRGNGAIRKIASNGEVTTLPGSYAPGSQMTSRVNAQDNFYVLTHETTADGSVIYRVDSNGNRSEVKRYSGGIRTIRPVDLAIDGQGRLYVLNTGRGNDHVIRIDPDGSEEMVYHYFTYGQTVGMGVDDTGNLALAFVGPEEDSSYIQWVPASAQPTSYTSSDITTQTLDLAASHDIGDLRFDSAGILYMTDAVRSPATSGSNQWLYSDFRVLRVVPNESVSTIINTFPDGSTQGRTIPSWQLSFGITSDAAGQLYVSDPTTHTIYRINSGGASSLIAGTPGEAGNSD